MNTELTQTRLHLDSKNSN